MSYRTIVLSDFLVEEIRTWFEYADFAEGERIFPRTKSFLHHEMDRGCLKSGVKRIRIHDLRHTWDSARWPSPPGWGTSRRR